MYVHNEIRYRVNIRLCFLDFALTCEAANNARPSIVLVDFASNDWLPRQRLPNIVNRADTSLPLLRLTLNVGYVKRILVQLQAAASHMPLA